MTRTAVCYAASGGHMFQTAVSAMQARAHVAVEVGVWVVFVHDGTAADDAEEAAFATVLARHDVTVTRLDRASLDGLDATFARYFLDLVLPTDVSRILYLDGDTQVLGDLGPLLALEPPGMDGFLACLDPMVLLRRVDPVQRVRIDRWWARAGLPHERRVRYLNSGVLLLERAQVPRIRSEVTAFAREHPGLVFPDQDALNVRAGSRAGLMSMTWNFPGFLLGTPMATVAPPRVVHFMSRPRPWNADLPPWGRRFYEPYGEVASREATLAPYWHRFGGPAKVRYRVQQTFKAVTERQVLATKRSAAIMHSLESGVVGRLTTAEERGA